MQKSTTKDVIFILSGDLNSYVGGAIKILFPYFLARHAYVISEALFSVKDPAPCTQQYPSLQ